MLRLPGSIGGLSVERIWFWKDDEPVSSPAQILRYLRVDPKRTPSLRGCVCADTAYTLMSDLKEPEETLWGRLNKNYRYEIRRAQKEDVQMSAYRGEDLRRQPDIMNDFERTYMSFCESLRNEDLKKDLDKRKISSYIEHDCILVTKAELGSAVVFHLYVTDEEDAVLCYSASDFRDDSVDQASAGRMNKLLHWHDMMLLKEQGCQFYDWGNVSSFEHYNGIDKFKAGFGGEQVTLENVFVGNRLLGKLAVGAKRLFNQ